MFKSLLAHITPSLDMHALRPGAVLAKGSRKLDTVKRESVLRDWRSRGESAVEPSQRQCSFDCRVRAETFR